MKILAKRSLNQRLEIISQFRNIYSKNVTEEIRKKLSGDLKHLIIALLTPLDEFYAQELHRAMNGLGTDEDVLIEILTTLSCSQITEIKYAYHKCKCCNN